MHRLISVESFESSDIPVLAVGCDGAVRYSNRAAETLFADASVPFVGRSCWRCFRLRAPDGGVFCRRDCPIRLHPEGAPERSMHEVVLQAGAAAALRFHLVTFPTATAFRPDSLILHLLVPVPAGAEAPPAMTRGSVAGRRLHLLTTREMQVLERLAAGLDPAAVASRLGMRLPTVRNHIRHILRKLDVHRQIEAVLALMERSGRPGPIQE